MKLAKRIALISIILAGFFFLLPSSAFAQSYEVEPALVISLDWQNRITQQQLDRYKADMLQALAEIRQWYASQLNGKTFQLRQDAEVVRSLQAAGDISDEIDTGSLYTILGGDTQFLIPSPNRIYAIALIGSEDLNPTGGGGAAIIAHVDLLALGGANGTVWTRDAALGVWAHELGHAFELVNAGYARLHTCSVITDFECQNNAPRPLPSAEEGLTDVMFYQVQHTSFNRRILHNTIHNPEVEKAYQSSFLNPQGDPGPTPFPLPRPSRLELSINGDTSSNQVFDPLEEVNFAVKLYNEALNPNNGCVPTDNPINFYIYDAQGREIAFLGSRLACQTVFYRLPDAPGTVETVVAQFLGEGALGEATAGITYRISAEGANITPSPPISPTPIVLSPQIISITPDPARIGENLHIQGTGFGTGIGEVTFYHQSTSPIRAQVVSWSNTFINILVPDDALSESIVTVRTRSGDEVSSSPITVIRNQPYPQALLLEISINGNDGDGQTFYEESEEESGLFNPWQVSADVPDQVTLTARLYIDQSGSTNEPCVPTNTNITFNLGAVVIGTAKPCEPLTIPFPQDPGTYTISASFPGDGLLASVTDTLTFTVAQAGTQTATPTQVPTPTVSSTSSGGLPAPTGIYTLPGSACNTPSNTVPCYPGYVCSALQFGTCVPASTGSQTAACTQLGFTCSSSAPCCGNNVCSPLTSRCEAPQATPTPVGGTGCKTAGQSCTVSGTGTALTSNCCGELSCSGANVCVSTSGGTSGTTPTPTQYVVQVPPNLYVSGCVFIDSNGDGKFNGVDRGSGSNFVYTCSQIESLGTERGYQGATLSFTGPPGTPCAGVSEEFTSGASGAWDFRVGQACRSGSPPVIHLTSPVSQTISSFVIHSFRGGTGSAVADFALPVTVPLPTLPASGQSPTPTSTPTGFGSTASPTPSATQAGSSQGVTLAASPAQVAPGGTITVLWSGLAASDVYWLISPSWAAQGGASFKYVANCDIQTPTGLPPPSGSCDFQAPSAAGIYRFWLLHMIPTSQIIATSNEITVGTAGQKQLVRITIDGQEVYRPGVSSPVQLDLRASRTRALVVEYIDEVGNAQSKTFAITFDKPKPPEVPVQQPPPQVCTSIDCAPPPPGCTRENAIPTSCDPNVAPTCGNIVCLGSPPVVSQPSSTPIPDAPTPTLAPTATPIPPAPTATPIPPAPTATPSQSSPCVYQYEVKSAPSYGCPGPGTMCYDGTKLYCTPH